MVSNKYNEMLASQNESREVERVTDRLRTQMTELNKMMDTKNFDDFLRVVRDANQLYEQIIFSLRQMDGTFKKIVMRECSYKSYNLVDI